MTTIDVPAVDRRRQSKEKLGALVQSRTQTLSLLTQLAGQQPFEHDAETETSLRKFCQALIDYTASAHFQLYRYLSDRRERRQSVRDVAEKAYSKIIETTDIILRFNDKYEALKVDDSFELLAADLSTLGESLAERINLEDQVIEAMSGSLAN